MKYVLGFLIVATTLLSCDKDNIDFDEKCWDKGKKEKTALIEFDCTGTYLKVEKKVLKVCNPDVLEGYSDGQEVDLKFDYLKECSSHDKLILCEKIYKYDAWIEITDESSTNASITTLERDCTGTYIRKGGKDYRVCNLDFVEAIESGEEVDVDFEFLEACPIQDNTIVCMMVHEFESWINVISI